MDEPARVTVERSAVRRAPELSARLARLHVVYPVERAAVLALEQPALVIGREPGSSGLLVPDPTVSRRHLAIEWHAGRGVHVVADLGSRNGSWLDGATLAQDGQPLADGAVLRLGDVLMVYEVGEATGPADAAQISREAVPGEAAAMRALRVRLARAAQDPAPLLLVGESGTGKERIAAEVHRLSGRSGSLLAINCAALGRDVVESQLFGHGKGAFTGATEAQPGYFRAAHGGTLFLDEIGELPLELQPKLLRALAQGEVQPVGSPQSVRVDVRVLAATNRDLGEAVASGRFRADLYARLALWELRVAPLRERRADLLGWIDRLDRQWRQSRGWGTGEPLRFEVDAAEALLLAAWPLNLRGLERLIHELEATGAASAPVPRERLPAWVQSPMVGPGNGVVAAAPRVPLPTREEFEAAYQRLGGSVRALARHFSRDRRQIYRWLQSYGLKETRPPADASHGR